MISIQNLHFAYRSGPDVLTDVCIDIHDEHIFAIMGQSGSGKTTLLNCIARFLTPRSGRILLDDRDVADMAEPELRRRIGVVFQNLDLFPHLTVLENLTLAPRRVQGIPTAQAEKEGRAMLRRLGIADLADAYPTQISGGQAQRVAIARGLLLKPDYMLLDEPTSALDAETTGDFCVWLRELHEDTHFIIVSHDVPFARELATHGVTMRDGRVERTGKIEGLLDQVRPHA